MEGASARFSRSSPTAATDRMVKTTSFVLKMPDSDSRPAEMVFIPSETKLTTPKLMDLVHKTWKLSLPNLLITCDVGSAHPTTLATRELCSLPQFEGWLHDAQAHLKFSAQRMGTGPPAPSDAAAAAIAEAAAVKAGADAQKKSMRPGSAARQAGGGRGKKIAPTEEKYFVSDAQATKPVDDDSLGLIQQVIFQKLCNVFAAVVEAAALSNNWIVVDRTTSKSPTAEYLLELAMQQASSRPTVIVIDSISRLHNFTSDKAEQQLAQLEDLKAEGTPLGADAAGHGGTVDWLYNPQEFLDPKAFHGLEMPRPTEPAHISPDGKVYPEMVWMYHYLQTLFASGTHYILLEDASDSFDVSPFGPLGYVVAHGGAMMYERLYGRIQTGQPLVMLHNTGGITQAFGSLLQAIAKDPKAPAEWLLERMEVVSRKRWASKMGLPEIMMMKELAERAPGLMMKTLVTVDLLQDTAEDVLATLTAAFEGQGGVPELGLGAAETLVVATAWRRHVVLFNNAKRFRVVADLIQWAFALLTLGTTALSVVYSEISREEYATPAQTLEIIQHLIVGFPVLIAMIVSIRSRMRPREKWAACLQAAHTVASEIFTYRLRVLEYDCNPTSGDSDGDGEGDSGGGASGASSTARAKVAREHFVERVSTIYSDALNIEVSKGGALIHRGTLSSEAPPEDFQPHLLRHYHKTLYSDKQKSLLENLTRLGEGKKDKNDADPDDLHKVMTTHTYMTYRAKKIAIYLERRAPKLALQLQILELLANVFNALSAVLALVGFAQFVAISIALSTLVYSFIEYWGLHEQVRAVNASMRDVHVLQTWWDSLSMIDRRTRLAKQHAVQVLEAAILQSVGANTGAAGGEVGGGDQAASTKEDEDGEAK